MPQLTILRTVSIALALVFGVAGLTQALADEPPHEDPNQAGTLASMDRYICTNEPQTGSRIPRRVCRTESQMTEDREEGREFIEDTIGWSSQRPRAS
jgi:hypothetical protein